MKKVFTKTLLFSAALFALNSVQAQDNSADANTGVSEIIDLSLEDLLKVAVVTASKSQESITDAPAVINVITAREIEAYGGQTLFEVLDRAASVYMLGNVLAPKNTFSMRGSVTTGPSRNVLILLDGRPMRESLLGGIHQSILNAFPLSRVERIEIIRGPGSVLYGSNAFSGVMNIITKKAEDQGLLNATASYGAFNTLQGNLSSGKKIGRLEVAGAVNYRKTDGDVYKMRTEKEVILKKDKSADSIWLAPVAFRGWEEVFGADLAVKYGDIKLAVNYTASDQYSISNRTSADLDITSRTSRLFADLNYQKEISEHWTSSLSFTYNNHKTLSGREEQVNSWSDNSSHDAVLEFTNFIKPLKNLNIVLGGLANYQAGQGLQYAFQSDGTEYGKVPYRGDGLNPDPFNTLPSYELLPWSTYLQADYKPFSFLKLIAGMQTNKIPGFKNDFVPRLGAIVHFNESFGLKTLYGQAFRAPAANERWFNVSPILVGNPGLLPEKVGTFDAQLFYTRSKAEVSLTYFNSMQTNLISLSERSERLKIINGMSVPMYVNRGNQRSQGLELEGKGYFSKSLSAQGSLTYQTSKDGLGNEDFLGMPKLMAKMGVHYHAPMGLSLGVFHSYLGKGGDISRPYTKALNPAVEDYHYMSANLTYKLNKLFEYANVPDMVLGVWVQNVLNEKVHYPEYTFRTINSIPGRPGRAINVNLRVKF